ncbi:uncharacterized protein SOCEGT47_029280 [Sorangium cellulosum]|uniref:HEPN domain-containing protein n=1 Tax=Sorangium cellulosum TaxID=56 RepID=A0A4P2PZT2_SORCE|nr:hypothetical protein [Sorangium cellulosum]AUX22425.1 uncharacterized protein SOCEGT47_029280 [Sorangium cellulosum]
MSPQKPAIVLHYRERADSFHRAARDLAMLDPPAYAPAIGLLAVHACIALADAVLVAVGEKQARAEDHGEAARRLRGWCSARKLHDGGVKHFEWLLSRKTRFSYEDRYVDEEDLLLARVKMDQFFTWAYQAFPDVARLKEADRA